MTTGNAYLTSVGSSKTVTDVSGQSLSYYESLIDSGIPVIMWGTVGMNGSSKVCWEATVNGKYVKWHSYSHCMVLIGYTENTYIFCDPLRGVVLALLMMLTSISAFAESPPTYYSAKNFEELMDWIRNTDVGETNQWGTMDNFIRDARKFDNILTVKPTKENCLLDEILVMSNSNTMNYFFTIDGKRFEVLIELPSTDVDAVVSLEEKIETINDTFEQEYEDLKYTDATVEIDGEERKIYYFNGGNYINKGSGESELLAPSAMFEMWGFHVCVRGIGELYGTDWDSSYLNYIEFEFGTEKVEISVEEGPRFMSAYNWMNPFDDLSRDWYYNDVRFVYTNGIMNGTGNTTFSPSIVLSRGMIVTILYRMEGSPSVEDVDIPFKDVDQSEWYSDAVKWAYNSGVVNGTSESTYAPNDPITRQDLAVILYRYKNQESVNKRNIEPIDDNMFVDNELIADYAKDAVKKLRNDGIIYGKLGNLFDPLGTASRAETAAMIHRFAS